MTSKKYFIACLVIMSALLPALSYGAGTASLSLFPKEATHKVGETFNVTISINPGSDKIDTVRAKLNFSPEFLEIKSFTPGPLFSYQAGSNGFDNAAGTFSWGAGTPGGITQAGNFGTIVFAVKKEGSGQVSVSSESLALSAGENKFNGQADTIAYALLPAAPAAPAQINKNSPNRVLKNAPPEEEKPEESNQTANIQNSPVETQLTSSPESKGFAAALMNAFSFSTAIRIGAVLLAVLLAALLALLIYRTKEDVAKAVKKNNK